MLLATGAMANPCENGLRFQSHPTDCSKFIQCFNTMPIEFMCQSGFYWNAEKETCDFSWNVNCNVVGYLDTMFFCVCLI